ncbi:Sensor protein lytS [Fibrisoma limi BUZ 3]|uniref:Sensor protein lytS n=1 Tax=Fibrisoma limi BUZ 3 TaxID=1185876 RepID=I2GSG6_9BACT|nr:sensor histidine kinase [Fibrisoma limi]CCH56845.1 Sensor protein lytS [Fibrisoma limi BUZ 3]
MKRWFILDRSDWLLLLGQYPVIPFVNYLMLGEPYLANTKLFLFVTVSTSVTYLLFVWLMDSWRKYVLYRFPALNQSTQRISSSLSVYIALTWLLCLVNFGAYEVADVPGYLFSWAKFGGAALLGMLFNVLSASIFEAIYFHGQWRKTLEREYELKQLNMQRQLDVLKQQVNPHFLFNSLNSLIALIGEDSVKAEVFAEELSSVYRYVLRTNRSEHSGSNVPDLSQHLTDLDSELTFIQSYYNLLKTRYGSGLHMIVCVDEQFGLYQLPPLTLQLLVENAVKHNVTLPEQPLHIQICTDESGTLRVFNNIQRKHVRVLSNGVGLSNILAKYAVLGQPAPSVREADGQFMVTLPLIKAV